VNEELQALDDERDALDARFAELRAYAAELAVRRDRAVQAHLDTLTDEQLRTDETAKRWLLRVASVHQGAYRRMQTVAAVGAEGARAIHMDGREEYSGDYLLRLDLALTQYQPVEALADAIRSWAGEWGLGREDIPVHVTESSCSAYGSYGGSYEIFSDNLRLDVSRYGSTSNVADGPLVDVLGYISKNLAYNVPTDDY